MNRVIYINGKYCKAKESKGVFHLYIRNSSTFKRVKRKFKKAEDALLYAELTEKKRIIKEKMREMKEELGCINKSLKEIERT